MIAPRLITAPTLPAVSLAEIKSQLRITWDDEDDKLESFAEASRVEFERLTGRTLYETTWEIRLQCWPCGPIHLPRAAPLWLDPSTGEPDITVVYKSSDGTETAWTDFVHDEAEEPALIAPAYGESYPSFTPWPLNPIRITYKAGIAVDSPQSEIAEEIKTCVLLMIGGLWEHREEFVLPERTTAATLFAANPVVARMISNLRVAYAC